MRAGTTRSLAYIRKRASENMRSTCRIERVLPPTWDETTNIATAGSREVIYEGPCRVWESQSTGMIQVGEEDFPLQSTTLSIPWDTAVVPKRDDEVVIISSHTDDHIVGMRYRIMDVAKAGDLRPSRRFSIEGITRDGSW